MFLTRKHLSRRTVLRGVGATVALPLLDAMIPARTALAQTAANPLPRLGFIYVPHGAIMDHWTPAAEGTQFELPAILAPLAPFRQQMTIVSGLENRHASGPTHAITPGTWLSGVSPRISHDPYGGVTADQIAAEHIGQDTPLPSLELSLEELSTISWSGPTTPLPMENNPQTVFTRLFGDGSTPEERVARRQQSQSLLDSVTEEIASLDVRLPAEDRRRIDQYLTDVREVERRITLAASQVSNDVELPEKPTGVPGDYETHASLMLDLIVLAWQTEITRVSTMMVAREISNAVYPASGINEPFHNLSHHSEIPAKLDRLAELNAYHTQTIMGYFLERLDSTPDGGGSLLDHSMVLYGSGMSNSNQHDHMPLPILLAGGASGRLQGGRHIRAGAGTPLSNVLVAMLDKLGVGAESFADSTGFVAI
jgi:hypothetical protein